MLTLVQDRKTSPWQIISVIGILLLALIGYLVFSSMHATAQEVTHKDLTSKMLSLLGEPESKGSLIVLVDATETQKKFC